MHMEAGGMDGWTRRRAGCYPTKAKATSSTICILALTPLMADQPGELLDSMTAFASGDLRGVISCFMHAATTTWLRLCPDGEVTKVQIEKSSLISELGMQPRDFRVMENRASRKVRAWVSPGGV